MSDFDKERDSRASGIFLAIVILAYIALFFLLARQS